MNYSIVPSLLDITRSLGLAIFLAIPTLVQGLDGRCELVTITQNSSSLLSYIPCSNCLLQTDNLQSVHSKSPPNITCVSPLFWTGFSSVDSIQLAVQNGPCETFVRNKESHVKSRMYYCNSDSFHLVHSATHRMSFRTSLSMTVQPNHVTFHEGDNVEVTCEGEDINKLNFTSLYFIPNPEVSVDGKKLVVTFTVNYWNHGDVWKCVESGKTSNVKQISVNFSPRDCHFYSNTYTTNSLAPGDNITCRCLAMPPAILEVVLEAKVGYEIPDAVTDFKVIEKINNTLHILKSLNVYTDATRPLEYRAICIATNNVSIKKVFIEHPFQVTLGKEKERTYSKAYVYLFIALLAGYVLIIGTALLFFRLCAQTLRRV